MIFEIQNLKFYYIQFDVETLEEDGCVLNTSESNTYIITSKRFPSSRKPRKVDFYTRCIKRF